MVTTLDERERTIIEMRFGQELTQARIGEELGISQMHVSRLLSRTLAKRRAGLCNAATGSQQRQIEQRIRGLLRTGMLGDFEDVDRRK